MRSPPRRPLLVLALAACLGVPGAAEERPWLLVGVHLPGGTARRALRIRAGRIEAIGDEESLRTGFPEDLEVVDGQGGLALPGLQDAHVHLEDGGLSLRQLSLADAMDLDDALEAVGEWAAEHPDSDWIEGGGWSYDLLPGGRFPDRHGLDRVVPDRPVILESFDGHAVWANTRALERAGFEVGTPDPPGGRILRETDGETPSGVLLETAADRIMDQAPVPSRGERLASLRAGLAHLVALGITAVDDMALDPEVLELYASLEAAGELPLRVRVALPLEGDLERYRGLRERYPGPLLQVGLLKGYVDGVIETRTAWMVEPYAGSEEVGGPLEPERTLRAKVLAAHRAGFQVALHCVGDRAVRTALDAFEEADRQVPGGALRHRVEHLEVVHPEDLPRFARLGVIASLQPVHGLAEPQEDEPDAWDQNLGPARVAASFPAAALRARGAEVVFGSDWPVASASPLEGLAAPPARGLASAEALRGYTRGAALEVGAAADLVVLRAGVDPARPETLGDAQGVRCVVVAGRVRYSRP